MLLFYKRDKSSRYALLKLLLHTQVYILKILHFRSVLIGPPISEIQVLKKLTLKIQGQGHWWGQSSKSQCEFNILSTHIPLVPCYGPPIPEIQHFHNLTLKIKGQGHSSRSQSRNSTHIPFVPCPSALPFLGYSCFKILHWKVKVKVMGEVQIVSHNMGPTWFSWLIWVISLSFHVNQASHSWVTTFSKFDLENQESRS